MERKQINKVDLKQRIAILGAGAAGLTAAEALNQKGYRHITIFERSDHAGGKCLSTEIDSKMYELGAGVLTKNNTVPLRLAKKYNIPIEQADFGHSIFVDKNGVQIPEQSLLLKFKVLWQLFFRYWPILKKYKELDSPGFHNIDASITVPFGEFAKKNKISDLADIFSLYLTGFGYCYADHVPAAYVLKYVNRKTIVAYFKKQAYIFPNGIQGLWTRIAMEYDVRFMAVITKISRAETVIIETEEGAEEFDKLIVTTPLDETLLFMDSTSQEKALFQEIMHLDYQTILCTVSNFLKMTGYVPDNFIRERVGHPVFWYYRHQEQPVYSFYVLADRTMSQDGVIENLISFVKKMGGKVESIKHYIHWKYFPHVGSLQMSNGFYDKLQNIQGIQHTNYVGELHNFSCVGFTSEYSEYIVNQHF